MADGPEEAAAVGASAPTRVYAGDGVFVEWRAGRCIHTAHCLMALPSVFDNQARPWVDLEGADPEAVAAAVRTCPTGALRYEGDDLRPDTEDGEVTIDAQPDGPLYVRGNVTITDHEDHPIADEPRVALCRCGASNNKPFCDNTHKKIGWREPE